MIKAVFLDVDNTLTDPKTHTVPESAYQAILAARKKGILVFAATGRNTLSEAESKTIAHIEFDGYVGMNGSICHFGKEEPFFTLPLELSDVAAAFSACSEMNVAMSVSTLRNVYITAMSDNVKKIDEIVDIVTPELIPKGFDYEKEAVFSLMPYASREAQALIMPRLINTVSARWNEWAFDIIPAGGGKHVGVQKMMEHFGLVKEDILAMGDGENDITMLEYAGIGVAMNHSNESVKKSADFVAPAIEPVRSVFIKYGII